MKWFIDPDHPFFVPVWRRWVASVAPLAWGGFEIAMGNTLWGVLFGLVGALAFWQLIVRGPSVK